jgi:DNA-binding NtrC family response regulator
VLLALLDSERPDLVLTDLKMPRSTALSCCEALTRWTRHSPLSSSPRSTIESAVAAVKEGAFDYLPKTFSVDQLTIVADRALR